MFVYFYVFPGKFSGKIDVLYIEKKNWKFNTRLLIYRYNDI